RDRAPLERALYGPRAHVLVARSEQLLGQTLVEPAGRVQSPQRAQRALAVAALEHDALQLRMHLWIGAALLEQRARAPREPLVRVEQEAHELAARQRGEVHLERLVLPVA